MTGVRIRCGGWAGFAPSGGHDQRSGEGFGLPLFSAGSNADFRSAEGAGAEGVGDETGGQLVARLLGIGDVAPGRRRRRLDSLVGAHDRQSLVALGEVQRLAEQRLSSSPTA